MLMFSIVLATAYATPVAKNEKKDSGLTIDSKEKNLAKYAIK